MNLPEQFWETQKGLLLVGEGGTLRFTGRGRAHYAPLFAKHGISISNVKTIDQFRSVMKPVNAAELDANTAELMRIMNDPLTTEEERATIRRVLNI
jgi:hypothetical protein